MRALIESDSLIQFLIATHLRTTVFKNDTVDLLMYDSMPNAKRIYENIKKSGIYGECYFITSVLAVGRTKLSRKEKAEKLLRWLEMLVNPAKGTKRILDIKNPNYDAFMFCANGIFLDGIFNVCKKVNPEMVCYRYEGSLTSYLHDHENKKGSTRARFEKIIKKIRKLDDVAMCVDKYYFFEPSLIQFENNYKIKKMPKILEMEPEVKCILNKIFEFVPESNYISEDVIAFEDGNLFYLNSEVEVSWYTESARRLGDRFVVRLHPRTGNNRYDVKIVKTQVSLAPWEIYLLNQNMSGKTLITCASGSVFTSLLYFGMNVKVIMLYKCANERIPLVTKEFDKVMINLQKRVCGAELYLPVDFNEYIDVINKC